MPASSILNTLEQFNNTVFRVDPSLFLVLYPIFFFYSLDKIVIAGQALKSWFA